MRIVCISDTHCKHWQIPLPDGDILIHSGDFTNSGNEKQIVDFNNWLGVIKPRYKHIILIAGNHDNLFVNNPIYARKLITNATYIEEELITIEGLKIYGTPVIPRYQYRNNAFGLVRGSIEMSQARSNIPSNLDILISHAPPYSILDSKNGKHYGCDSLLRKLCQDPPKILCSGHIHEGYGLYQTEQTTFINASILDSEHIITNNPIILDI